MRRKRRKIAGVNDPNYQVPGHTRRICDLSKVARDVLSVDSFPLTPRGSLHTTTFRAVIGSLGEGDLKASATRSFCLCYISQTKAPGSKTLPRVKAQERVS